MTSSRTGLLQISLAGVLWGTGGLALQVIRDVTPMSVLTVSAWRMAIAALVLVAALAGLRRLPSLAALLRRQPAYVVLVGASTAAYQALYFASVVLVGVTVATVISLGLAPVLVTAIEGCRRHQLPGRQHLLILAAALAGLVLVSASAGLEATGPQPLLGVLAAVGSGTAYALTTLVGAPLARSTSPLTLTTATTTVGALVLLPFGLLADGPTTSSDPLVVGTLLYLGVLTMALAYGLLYAGLRTTPGSSAVIATLVEPVTAAAVAALFLDERIGPAGVAGTVLILAAVAGLGRRPMVPPA